MGTYTVTFPDFKWGVTQGDDADDAMETARDLLKILVKDAIDSGGDLPTPSRARGRNAMLVSLSALHEAKLALYFAMREARLRNSDLARRLRKPVAHVRQLLDLDQSSKIDHLETAFRVLEKSIGIQVRSAA